MQFNHDNRVGPELAVSLVNADPGEDLEQVLREHAIRWPELDDAATQALREWADALRAAFTTTDPQQRCVVVNRLLDAAAGRLHLTTHDGLRPHLHLVADDRDVVARVKAVTAGRLAFLTAWTGGTRLGACARDGCQQVFVDTSRNGRRRYCSARCGNYDAVARHRAATH